MKKFIMILIILGLGIFIWKFFNKPVMAPSTPQEITENETIDSQIQPQGMVFDDQGNFFEEGESYKITVSTPMIENEQIKSDIQGYLKPIVDEFKDFVVGTEDVETPSFPWTLDLTVETVESDLITTYIINEYDYTGGAHPNSFKKTFHYLKETGEKITTQDLIPDSDTLYILAALADKELVVEYPEGSSGESYDNWDIWFADNTSVTFIFTPYQIASYAAGEQQFNVVAIGDNANIFNQNYFISE